MRASERDPETTYEWSDITRETHASVIIEASKTKGSFDYKSLLEIYFPRIKDNEIDLFNLLIKTILSNSVNNITGKRFSEEWEEINQSFPRSKKHTRKIQELENSLDNFNLGLRSLLNQLENEAANILKRFGYPVLLNFDFQGVTFDLEKKCE